MARAGSLTIFAAGDFRLSPLTVDCVFFVPFAPAEGLLPSVFTGCAGVACTVFFALRFAPFFVAAALGAFPVPFPLVLRAGFVVVCAALFAPFLAALFAGVPFFAGAAAPAELLPSLPAPFFARAVLGEGVAALFTLFLAALFAGAGFAVFLTVFLAALGAAVTPSFPATFAGLPAFSPFPVDAVFFDPLLAALFPAAAFFVGAVLGAGLAVLPAPFLAAVFAGLFVFFPLVVAFFAADFFPLVAALPFSAPFFAVVDFAGVALFTGFLPAADEAAFFNVAPFCLAIAFLRPLLIKCEGNYNVVSSTQRAPVQCDSPFRRCRRPVLPLRRPWHRAQAPLPVSPGQCSPADSQSPAQDRRRLRR